MGMYMCIWVYGQAFVHWCIQVCMGMNTRVQMCMGIYGHVHTCPYHVYGVYVPRRVCMSVYMCVWMYKGYMGMYEYNWVDTVE